MSIESMVTKVKSQIDEPIKQELGSNLIEPTEAMVKRVLELYIEGKDIWTIKTNVKKKDTNLKLSESQIIEIINEYKRQTAPVIEEKGE
jgi:hypothetical protein